MLKKIEVAMYRIGIVSCDKWKNKIIEDILLKEELTSMGHNAEIISWQQPLNNTYDILILRSVWGYQNDYSNFKKWLISLNDKKIKIVNDVDLIINNIDKFKQFEILKKYNKSIIKTVFLKDYIADFQSLEEKINSIKSDLCVIKPSISGSGENTFLFSKTNKLIDIPNFIKKDEVLKKINIILEKNDDCRIMIQPYIKEINSGEYSCIFIDGNLSHVMLRFPNIFHEKKQPYIINEVPKCIMDLAMAIEKIPEYSNYLYMRVDIVIQNDIAKVMEVELAEPDLLTRYVDTYEKQNEIIKSLSEGLERRIK